MNDESEFHPQYIRQQHDFIEKQLGTVADSLRALEHLVYNQLEFENICLILENVEWVARAIENFRLSALVRAVHLMLQRVVQSHPNEIQPSTYAYLLYSIKTVQNLSEVSKCASHAELKMSGSRFGEAIGAIIDHTDELSLPHMTR